MNNLFFKLIADSLMYIALLATLYGNVYLIWIYQALVEIFELVIAKFSTYKCTMLINRLKLQCDIIRTRFYKL